MTGEPDFLDEIEAERPEPSSQGLLRCPTCGRIGPFGNVWVERPNSVTVTMCKDPWHTPDIPVGTARKSVDELQDELVMLAEQNRELRRERDDYLSVLNIMHEGGPAEGRAHEATVDALLKHVATFRNRAERAEAERDEAEGILRGDHTLTHYRAENKRLRAERDRLREALEADAQDPCDAAAFYGEDGYDKCLDPEYNDMSGNPTLTRCYSCRARAALRSPENPPEEAQS